MNRLSPCPCCERHVRAGSPACPFCSCELAPGFEAPIYRPTQRLGRAAMLAFRTLVIGAAGATVGCGASTGLEPPDDGGATMLVDSGTARSDAGLDAGVDAGFDAGFDSGTVIAAYGAPPPPDAGVDSGTDPTPIPAYGTPSPIFDAGSDAAMDLDGGGTGNLYGAPPDPDA